MPSHTIPEDVHTPVYSDDDHLLIWIHFFFVVEENQETKVHFKPLVVFAFQSLEQFQQTNNFQCSYKIVHLCSIKSSHPIVCVSSCVYVQLCVCVQFSEVVLVLCNYASIHSIDCSFQFNKSDI